MDFNRWIASLPSRDPAVLVAAADRLAPADRGILQTWLGKRALSLSSGSRVLPAAARASSSTYLGSDTPGSTLFVQDYVADEDCDHVTTPQMQQAVPKMAFRPCHQTAGLSNTGHGPLLPWYSQNLQAQTGVMKLRSQSEAAQGRNHCSDVGFAGYTVDPHRSMEIERLQQHMENSRRSNEPDDVDFQIEERWYPSAGSYSEFKGNHMARISHQQECMRTRRSRSEASHRAAQERFNLGISRPWPLSPSHTGSKQKMRPHTPESTTLDPPFAAKRVTPQQGGRMWRTFG